MPVTNSSYVVGTTTDVAQEVTETHTLAVGDPVVVTYLAALGSDLNAAMVDRARRINNSLARGEYDGIVRGQPGPLTLNEQTAAQFAERFWTDVQRAFRDRDKLIYARLLWWLYEMVVGGWLTSAQARNSFNAHFGKALDATEWNTLVTSRIAPAHDRYAGLIADTEVW